MGGGVGGRSLVGGEPSVPEVRGRVEGRDSRERPPDWRESPRESSRG